MHLARAGSSGLASSTVALKLKCAFGSSGLERIGLESGGLETINRIWRRLGWTVILSKNLEASKGHLARAGSSGLASSSVVLKLQSPSGSSGLERNAKRVRRDRTKRTSGTGPNGSFSRPKFDTISKWFLDTCFSNPLEPAAAKWTLKLHFLNGFWRWKLTKIGTIIRPKIESKKHCVLEVVSAKKEWLW